MLTWKVPNNESNFHTKNRNTKIDVEKSVEHYRHNKHIMSIR